jgi:flagellar biosynthesis/type III secretory pathway chaperone
MKSLQEFKQDPTTLDEEKSDYTKFDMLVRAGLANKSQLARLHRILDKMKEERPVFNPTDRAILQDLFNKMIGIITNNKQIFQRTRQVVREDLDESIIDSSTYKISPSGRKVRTHRIKIGDERIEDEDEKDTVKEDVIQLEEQRMKSDPPFVLVLKRKALRLYPNGMKIALYHNDKLNKYFSIPYSTEKNVDAPIQAESVQQKHQSVFQQLSNILENQEPEIVYFSNGDKTMVDVETASVINTLYESINDHNKYDLISMVNSSQGQFDMVLTFAYNKVK